MTVEHAAELLERCFWCNRRDCRASGWEQEHHAKGWHRLCGRCASTRLRNPCNALLSLRKAAEPISVPDDCPNSKMDDGVHEDSFAPDGEPRMCGWCYETWTPGSDGRPQP